MDLAYPQGINLDNFEVINREQHKFYQIGQIGEAIYARASQEALSRHERHLQT
jgi:hypothetical protein